MSIGDSLKGKNLIIVAAAALVLFIVVVVVFFPAQKENSGGPEVISKRVKINIEDDTAQQTETAKTDASHLKEAEKPSTEPVVKGAEKAVESPIKIEIAEPAPAEKAPEKKPEPVKTAEKAPARSVEKSVTAAPQKTRTTVASKAPSRGTWALNVASFTNLPDAKTLRGKLKDLGYNSYITEFTKDSVRWYRVRVGFYQTRGQAEGIGKKIKQRFKVQTPWVVKPPKEEVSAYAG